MPKSKRKTANVERETPKPSGILRSTCYVQVALFRRLSVLPHHAHDDALHLYLLGIDKDWLHRGIGRLQANLAARIAIELLERHVRSAKQRDDHLAVLGGFPIFHDDEVAVPDLLVDHR